MSALLAKTKAETPENTREFPLFALMTKVLIQSLCPLLKSEILFGNIESSDAGESFPYWIDANVTGDLAGKFGLGADKHTLKTLAFQLKVKGNDGKSGECEVITLIHETLANELDKQCQLEDFHCQLTKGTGIVIDYSFSPPAEKHYFCPIETKYGILKAYFSLNPTSQDLHDDLLKSHSIYEPRKIRVYASQLDFLYKSVRNLESFEKQLLNGPHIRTKMRAQIKKVKRLLHQLKSESLDGLFIPARKLVVDISKQQGKQIKFATHGTWLCLDKTLLNFLYEPILHLIRNAVDHGIEEPSERERLGKPSAGNIRCLAAFNEKGLRLVLSDDGRGLNLPKIRERAVAKGILSQEMANRAMIDQLCDLIFKPGFSTRESADSFSGRGLGLDIVRKGIESVGGHIKILSTSNHGTSFEICIPLSEDFQTNLYPQTDLENLNPKEEEEERQLLFDELSGYFDRMMHVLQALKNEPSVQSSYELYRLAHSIKGAAGFLGWNRVAGFCHHYEELLKLVSEEKTSLDDKIIETLFEAGLHLKDFCGASKTNSSYPLFHIRRLEARILQVIWTTTKSDEQTHLFLGKYHLCAVENFIAPLAKGKVFSTAPETDFAKAMKQPFGALVQFSGDRKGFAGILLPEETFTRVVHPLITGSREKGKVKQQLWSLGEFASVMGQAITELSQRAQINLQASAPLTYYGWGQPLRILGNPTYCYSCEIDGAKFYLAGDFRMPAEIVEGAIGIEPSLNPKEVMREATHQCQKHFSVFGLKINWNEQPTQSDLVGFDGGMTAIISCVSPEPGGADYVLFLSYESNLAQHIHKTFVESDSGKPSSEIDVYDCLNETSNIVGGLLIAELEKKKMALKLSLPTIFVGKAYVANFNRLYVTSKLVGATSKGKFELQILVTQLAG